MNEYLHWWYTLVVLILLTPLLVSASFTISWFTKDSKATRTMFFTAQILALVSVLLVCIWNIIYFVAIYKKDLYYSGMGEISKNVYTTQSKKVFLFIMIVFLITFCSFSFNIHSSIFPLQELRGLYFPISKIKTTTQKFVNNFLGQNFLSAKVCWTNVSSPLI